MWPFVISNVRRPDFRRHRPDVSPLEDRCLLSVTLSETPTGLPYVGTPVVLSATSGGHGHTPVYQFRVGQPGGPLQVVSDFSRSDSFTWNPMQQGTYVIQVVVKGSDTAARSETASSTYTAHSRVTGNTAVVSPMANPLVALYSAPPTSGTSMSVQFAALSSNPTWQETSPKAIIPGESTNFIVAGMLPDTTYLMRDVVNNGTVSAPLEFTTGSLPGNMKFPSFTVVQPPGAGTDFSQGVIFHAGLDTSTVNTVATNLAGQIVWYYDPVANHFSGYATNIEPGGSVMILGGSPVGNTASWDTLRQVDLAGNTLRQTNIHAVNAQLVALHLPPILSFSHEAKLLPNGDTAVLAETRKVAEYRGKPTTFVGNMVLVLDPNFQVSWAWNSFHWLSTNQIGKVQGTPKNWLHANAVSWSPEDNNLIVSLRTPSLVLKIDYANGTGNGHILWKLGAHGNFQAIANTSNPWFSGQHDVRYINNNTLLVFDDGNNRRQTDPTANSRGQEWLLNEQNMTATLLVNAHLGNYSPYLGSVERLSNGNLAFTSGGLGTPTDQAGQSIEVLPNGSPIYSLQMNQYEYRSFFENTLYDASLLN